MIVLFKDVLIFNWTVLNLTGFSGISIYSTEDNLMTFENENDFFKFLTTQTSHKVLEVLKIYIGRDWRLASSFWLRLIRLSGKRVHPRTYSTERQ